MMDKPNFLGFATLELSKLSMYKIYYEKLQPYFCRENLQLHYLDFDSSVSSIRSQNIIKQLKNLEYLIDFSNLNENHELFNYKNKKFIVKFKTETPENIWIDEFIALRFKAYSFQCNDKNTNKTKSLSKYQSKNIKFDEYCKCFFGGEYQKPKWRWQLFDSISKSRNVSSESKKINTNSNWW